MSQQKDELTGERPRLESISGNGTIARMGRFALYLESLADENEARATLQWVNARVTCTWEKRRRERLALTNG